MTRLITPGAIFVEGESDQKILANWFPRLQFVVANGKNNVYKRVTENTTCWGLLDRDFADTATVDASRAPGNRVALLRRYCIENYLLEPAMIASVAGLLVDRFPEVHRWTDPALCCPTNRCLGK